MTATAARDPRTALVLFSGGQDSTTCLAWALDRFSRVETVGFDYGQRHRIELDCRLTVLDELRRQFPQWADRLGDDHVLDLGLIGQLSDTALTAEREIEFQANGLPNTFVPGRNLIFLCFAGALAYRRGTPHLVAGMCETDYSGYPDCRDSTLKAMRTALNLGMDQNFTLHTPLMWIDKAASFALACDIGGDEFLQVVVEDSHSCYLGVRSDRHNWGYGCGECPACQLRAAGFAKWNEQCRKKP